MAIEILQHPSGPPQPPEPFLEINSSSQLDVHWDVPYSNEKYPVKNYNILIVNMSLGDVLASVLEYNETSFVHIFDDEVQYCQILTVNVTAVSALGPSVPGSASRGFPIGKHYNNHNIMVVREKKEEKKT